MVCGIFTMVPASLLGSLHPPTHQAGKDCHHHFWFDLHKVFWESVDTCANLSGHGDGISREDRVVIDSVHKKALMKNTLFTRHIRRVKLILKVKNNSINFEFV